MQQKPLVGLPIQFHTVKGDCIPATIRKTTDSLNVSVQYTKEASSFSIGAEVITIHNVPHISQLQPEQKTDFWCGIGEMERRAAEATTATEQ